MITEFLQDALFAAIAAIGFAAISDPPRKAYLYCATIAAAGHSVRFLLQSLLLNICFYWYLSWYGMYGYYFFFFPNT